MAPLKIRYTLTIYFTLSPALYIDHTITSTYLYGNVRKQIYHTICIFPVCTFAPLYHTLRSGRTILLNIQWQGLSLLYLLKIPLRSHSIYRLESLRNASVLSFKIDSIILGNLLLSIPLTLLRYLNNLGIP